MTDDGEDELAVDEFAEYCRTQAGLLSGSVERMREEADALLDEIDEGAAEVRARLDDRTESAETTASPSAGGDAPDAAADLGSIAELESDLEEKQAVVEAKQARMTAFRELAAGYADLAAELRSEVEDGREAMDRVVRFEVDRDAPAYFDDRQTVCEAAAQSPGSEGDADGGSDAEDEGDADGG